MKKYHLETLVLHGGSYRKDETTGSIAPPIYQTSAFAFKDTEDAAKIFSLQKKGNFYSRISNPTCDCLEERVAALEGGVAAVSVSSGQSAIYLSVINLAQSGDNIVSSTDIYGGTNTLFTQLAQRGIEVRFVDPTDPENFRKKTDRKTRAYFGETLANPRLSVFPIQEVATIGREHNIPLIIDNTTTPIICQPLQYGAAVVVHSLTKYIGGHGTSIGGIIVDGGNFDWQQAAKQQPLITSPDKNYKGLNWQHTAERLFGKNAAFALRARSVSLKTLGCCLSPMNAFFFLQGIETLALRMEKHCSNTKKVADFLQQYHSVQRVIFPLFFQNQERVKKYLNNTGGAIIGLELNGGAVAGKNFINSLKLFYHASNIGDARSIATHPASTTHSELTEEQMMQSGIHPGYIRLSIGIENHQDLIEDIQQALL